MKDACESLMLMLSASIVLALPDFEVPIIIETDALSVAIEAVISQ